MPRQITAYSNPLVKHVRDLRDKRHRRMARQFLAEGLRILTEARETGRVPRLLFFAAASARHPLVERLVAAVEAGGGEAIETTPDILSKLSGKDNPQAVVGVFDEFATTLDSLDRASAGIWLVAERLRDPGNLGTILRTGDAIGAGGLILIGDCVDPFSVEAVRASMGALFTVPVVRCGWEDFIAWLRGGPGTLVGLSLQTEHDYRAPAYPAPTFLLTGNEAQGLPDGYEAACDLLVKLPMLGKADSLNAAVATAVMAYQVLASQRG
ncbi:RNA methyltransferase [uncultured Sphingomonas sp.]|uniref:TrmH family RNA methyltransferase n=1 Tax=uncultured Sphingomonas sp. TaxID=158754 RepID=UPI00262434FB|nr:RNA methyltransferase [uncultured Sphingomonas sp.]